MCSLEKNNRYRNKLIMVSKIHEILQKCIFTIQNLPLQAPKIIFIFMFILGHFFLFFQKDDSYPVDDSKLKN